MAGEEPITKLLAGERRTVEIEILKPNPDNPKSITRKHLDRLKNSIEELGYILPILVNQDMRIIDGHQRVKALKEQGIERVEVTVITLDEEKELLALLATDQTYGQFDRTKRQDLYNLLEERGARLDILADYLQRREENRLDTGAEFDRTGRVDIPEIQYGDVIRLGKHYLICGDSKDPDIWKKVREIGIPYLFCTSPPYYNQREEYSSWDNIGAYLKDMYEIIKLSLTEVKECIYFINIGCDLEYNLPAKFDSILEENSLSFLDNICWFKPNLNLNIPRFKQIRSHKLYYPAFQWEHCMVYTRGERHRFENTDTNYIHENFLSNVWKFTTIRDEKRWHPAPYPLELAKTAIQCYSNKGDIVLDPFVGSGTTIYAGEELDRVVIGIELCPEYCEKIIQKWNEDYAGEEDGKE